MEVISQHVLYCVLSHLGHGGDLLACLLYVEPFGHGGDFSARTVLCVEPFGAPGITITYIIYFAQCCSVNCQLSTYTNYRKYEICVSIIDIGPLYVWWA